ncbi:MAG TPA: RNA methyltransferase [Gemmatimonadales bacterium]|nr:RNA methyltransferase [Gemmatimonadales bacterium]
MAGVETLIRDLRLRRGRERRGLALAEGVRLVEEALAAGVTIRQAATSPALEATPRGGALKAALGAAHVPLTELDDRALAELADTEHPQGVIAVIEPRHWALGDLAPRAGEVVVVLDAVQDPGNVGAIARAALGLGASGLVALKGTAELTNPKVLRGSMGALFRLPSVSATDAEFLAWAERTRAAVWVTDSTGERPVGGPPASPVALVLGNEGAGVRAELARGAARRLAIPLAGGVESLNVAVAAGILLYEVRRDA